MPTGCATRCTSQVKWLSIVLRRLHGFCDSAGLLQRHQQASKDSQTLLTEYVLLPASWQFSPIKPLLERLISHFARYQMLFDSRFDSKTSFSPSRQPKNDQDYREARM